jgi:hypothetical protein
VINQQQSEAARAGVVVLSVIVILYTRGLVRDFEGELIGGELFGGSPDAL